MNLLFEGWRKYLQENLEIDQEKYDEWKSKWPNFDDVPYKMSIAEDAFIHFTPLSRARKIKKSGRLLMRPPYDKFGIDAVTAISRTYGSLVPSVQTTHIKLDGGELDDEESTGDELAAIIFRTNTLPKYGRVEEVVWERDVVFTDVDIISPEEAEDFLAQTSKEIGDNEIVFYY
jgi:hypothetical protein